MPDQRSWTLPPSSAVIADVIRAHTALEFKDDLKRLMDRVKCQCGDELQRDFHASHVAHKVWKYLESIRLEEVGHA